MERYTIEKVIGEGTYGVVFKAVEKGTQDVVAIKKFKTVGDEQLSKREIQACSMLSHPFIVSYRNSFRHEGLLHLVFDYVSDSLHKLLGRHRRGLPPRLAQRLIYQLCQALQYCHANRIIHRDVKPDNILIDERGDIRLCDFGVARTIQFDGDPLSDYVATRWYRPPEQELRMDRYSFDADIWSVGCILVELLTGRPLFPGNSQIDQLNLIQETLGPLPSSLAARLPRGVTTVPAATRSLRALLGDKDLPPGTLDFLDHTMHLEPRCRLSASACLAHEFLKPLRDAEQRERKARLCDAGDDGIEEDIPGAQMGTPVAPLEKAARNSPQRADPKSVSPTTRSTAECRRPEEAKRREHKIDQPCGPRRPLLERPCDNNPSEGDIEEIIESDGERPRSRGAKSPGGCKAERLRDTKTEAEVAVGRRNSGGAVAKKVECCDAKRSRDSDPHDHECYEDDFEE
ncbi:hypothetical protein ATCC90586_005000 [Pythium insidiosum]|nr:hypothetical protein ATCC90586_005000 [Pythium insidiosum]